ncbi:TRAP transporter small permease [Bacillus sp. MRMR6]|uniref:TRAP transporter small permease n=1 Tax=Bacillus sp. MRMR6 TaxID=1928617 RepID=UPI0009515882|nr:TRAP transporter small permease [Bacillus sp. MRMR6]OLS33583.1 hypothetical protein BTR25_25135 [Bacillus sp. MRMR6]
MDGEKKRLNLIEWLVSIFLITIVLVNFFNVIGRYLFHKPIFWSDQISTLLLVWIVFLGSALATASKSHMVIDFFFNKFSVTWQKVLLVIGGILVNLALLYITIYSANVTWILKDQELASLPFSRAWSFAPIPIGCALMIYYITVNIISNLRKAGELS